MADDTFAPKPGEPISDSGLARATYRMQVETLAIAIVGDIQLWWKMTELVRETYRRLAVCIGRGEPLDG